MRFVVKKMNGEEKPYKEPEKHFCGVFQIQKLINRINDEDFKGKLLGIIQDAELVKDKEAYSSALLNRLKKIRVSLSDHDKNIIKMLKENLFCSDGKMKFKHKILHSHFSNSDLQNDFHKNYLLSKDLSLLLDMLEKIDKLKRIYSGDLSADEEFYMDLPVNIDALILPLQEIYRHYPDKEHAKRALHIEIWSCYNSISRFCAKISERQGGIKDRNPDFPWKSVEILSSIFSINPVGVMANLGMEKVKNDLDELEKRLKLIIQKQLFLNPSFDSALLREFKGLEFPSKHDRILLKDVNFNSADVVRGLPNIRKFTEDFMDYKNLTSLARLFVKLKECDPSSPRGREAVISIVQQIGEISSNISPATRSLMKDYPFDQLRKLRNNIAHSVDRPSLYDKLNKYIDNSSLDVILKLKEEILTLEDNVNDSHKSIYEKLDYISYEVDQDRRRLWKRILKKLRSVFTRADQDDEKLWEKFSEVRNAEAPFPEPVASEEIDEALAIVKKSLPEDQRETPETQEKLASMRALFEGDLPQPSSKGDVDKIFNAGKEKSNAAELMGASVNGGLFRNRGSRRPLDCTKDQNIFVGFLSNAFKYPKLDEDVLAEKEFITMQSLTDELDKDGVSKSNAASTSISKSEQYLDLILDNIKKISIHTQMLDDKSEISIEKIREKCKADVQYHNAVLFRLSIIGQAVQKLNSSDARMIISAKLRREFVVLRDIRNAIMHDHREVDEGQVLKLYSNDLEPSNVVGNGKKAFDLSKYLNDLKSEIEKTKQRIANKVEGSAERELEFLVENVYDGLQEASERDQHKCAFILEEVLGVEIIDENFHGEDRFTAAGKWYIPLNVAKEVLRSVERRMLGGRITLQNFIDESEKIKDLCERHKVKITGIYGTLARYSYAYEHNDSGVVVEFEDPKNFNNVAKFKKQFKALFEVELSVVTHEELLDQRKSTIRNFEKTMNGYELFKAVEVRDVGKVRQLISTNPYMDQRVEGYCAFNSSMMDLHVGKSLEIAKILLENGSDVNCFDKHGNTELYYAIQRDDVESYKFLIANGADGSKLNKSGKTESDYLEKGSKICKEKNLWKNRVKKEKSSHDSVRR